MGLIDGHNMDHLIPVLKNCGIRHPGPGAAALRDGKGKGYAGGDKRGQVSRCGQVRCDYRDAAQGDVERPSTKVFANSLIKEADQDGIVAITAAMPDGTGLDLFEKAHPSGSMWVSRSSTA